MPIIFIDEGIVTEINNFVLSLDDNPDSSVSIVLYDRLEVGDNYRSPKKITLRELFAVPSIGVYYGDILRKAQVELERILYKIIKNRADKGETVIYESGSIVLILK